MAVISLLRKCPKSDWRLPLQLPHSALQSPLLRISLAPREHFFCKPSKDVPCVQWGESAYNGRISDKETSLLQSCACRKVGKIWPFTWGKKYCKLWKIPAWIIWISWFGELVVWWFSFLVLLFGSPFWFSLFSYFHFNFLILPTEYSIQSTLCRLLPFQLLFLLVTQALSSKLPTIKLLLYDRPIVRVPERDRHFHLE